MIIDIITLFPDMFKGPFDESILKKAQEKKLVQINIHNLRQWAIDKRGTVDDRPYGGGKGMILRPEPIDAALRHLKIKKDTIENRYSRKERDKKLKIKNTYQKSKIILLSPTGKVFNQKMAQKLAKLKWLTLICGHYEGVDYRVHKYLADEVISIGDYILTGGEIPAMVIVDSVVRLLPGVLEKEATQFESFSSVHSSFSSVHSSPSSFLPSLPSSSNPLNSIGMDKIEHVVYFVKKGKGDKTKTVRLLEYPQYTRPENFRGHKVPKVLLSGNHQKIAKWRLEQAIRRTRDLRPDLLR